MMTNPFHFPLEQPTITLIIPIYNEREVLPLCLQRLAAVIEQLDIKTELLFVDDGSKDTSANYLLEQVWDQFSIRVIRLSRNFGKEAALTAGLDYARSDAVIILDADLQDPPELIPNMISQWRQGADVVLMQRRSRAGDSCFKRTTSHLFYRILKHLGRPEIPSDTGDFRLMSRLVVEALKKLPERNRFMKGLFAWVGMPTVILEYDRAPRAAGSSKWNYLGLLQLAVEGITSFSIAPLRYVAILGILSALIGGTFGLSIGLKALILGDPVRGYPSLISIITFLGGIQLFALGVVGEYVGKTYMETKQRPNYLVRDVLKIPAAIHRNGVIRVVEESHAQPR
ncbi:MAG: glycosyltransferase family 2 protein [Nitrospirae bacterium]|nr:glycosyltransferase family 2 protein [Candidatus Manganitrophaceae bacterium]